jgi:hypothetical protein
MTVLKGRKAETQKAFEGERYQAEIIALSIRAGT